MTEVLTRPPAVRRSPGSAALADYLTAQIVTIVDGDVRLRTGSEPVHDVRVAIRRLRSTLRVFAAVLDDPAATGLDADLAWFAGLLGDVRDCQVAARRFDAALAELPPELVLGPVRSRIRTVLTARRSPAWAQVTEALDTPRHAGMLAGIQRWIDDPPVPPDVGAQQLRKKAGRAARKADRRLTAALGTGDAASLHKARKAAKRARYAAELVRPTDRTAKRTVKRYKGVQSILGDHQDTVVASDLLWRLACATASVPDENGFTFGLLYAREQDIARACRRAVAQSR